MVGLFGGQYDGGPMNDLRQQRGVTKTYAGGYEQGAEVCAIATTHPTAIGTVANATLTARLCVGDSGRTTSAPSVCLSNDLSEGQ